MSIINDALKRAEQFRKWTSSEVLPVIPSASRSEVAVLDEPLPPKVQPVTPRPKIKVEAPTEIPKPLPEKKIETQAASPNSFLIVSLVGLSISIVVALFLLLSHFSANQDAILNQSAAGSASGIQADATVLTEIQAPAVVSQAQTPTAQAPKPEPKRIIRKERKTPRPPKSQYQLTGVYGIGGSERYAFINGKIVQTGGIVNDASVVSIDQNSVTLKRGSRVFVLTMP